jgi:hypothetical protein
MSSPFDLTDLDDMALLVLAQEVTAEQHRRALEACDPEALVREGFSEGFTTAGMPRDPWIYNGILVCCGAKNDRSATSHECAFVSIGEKWVWECQERFYDEVRNVPGPKPIMRSVTLCAVHEGMEVDLVTSQLRTGVHTMKNVRSFQVVGGELVLVGTRAQRADHRRER